MLRSSYTFRNFIKERVCQIYDTLEYATLHPHSSLKKEAHRSTVDYIRATCPKAIPCRTPQRLLDLALSRVTVDGYYLEFGVFKGASLRYIAKKNNANARVYGFDSFEGLPEDWVHNVKGAFSVQGKLPRVPSNVTLIKGYYQDTLEAWLELNTQKVAFLHIDCDLYSSTRTVVKALQGRFQKGTVIVFDDYFNFPGWQDDGHKVLTEYLGTESAEVVYLGYAFKELAVQIC